MALVTAADVRAHLNLADTTHDSELQGFIDAATQVIINICGPIESTSYDEWYDGGSPFIELRHLPLVSVTTVTEYRGSTGYTLTQVATPDLGTTYSYMVELLNARLVRRSAGGGLIDFPGGLENVHVVYAGGYSAVPANVRLGCLELVRVLYQQTQQGGRPQMGAGAVDDSVATPMGFFVPNRVVELLAPHQRFPSIG